MLRVLIRGGLVTLANWPIVLIDFAVESLYKMALVVPVVGGAMLVAVVTGGSVRPLLAEGVRAAVATTLSALADVPAAFASFIVALLLVSVGGALLMFLLKAGTLAVLVEGERRAPPVEREALRYGSLARSDAYRLETLLGGVERFGRRMMALGLWLSGAYAVLGLGYVAAMTWTVHLSVQPGFNAAWPLVAATATGSAVAALALVNLIFDLMRVVVVCEDVGLRRAAARLSTFVMRDARRVIGIFAVITGLRVVGAAASLLFAAGLAIVAWVPVVGLIVVPVQAAAWLLRGLLFQYVSVTAVCAYTAEYRRFMSGS